MVIIACQKSSRLLTRISALSNELSLIERNRYDIIQLKKKTEKETKENSNFFLCDKNTD